VYSFLFAALTGFAFSNPFVRHSEHSDETTFCW